MRVRDGKDTGIGADGVEVDDWDGVARRGRKKGSWLTVRGGMEIGRNARQQEGCVLQVVRDSSMRWNGR